MKLIGITPRILVEDGVQKEFVNTRYVKQLTNRGFNVIMLTLDNPNPKAILDMCDGFLITGGFDIDPKYFNEDNNGLSQNCNHSLDILDKEIVEYAALYQKPLLGICRGHQAINIFLGGSLHQDIGKTHKSIKSDHEVITFKNNFINFKPNIKVNSYHHQSINRLAPNMEIVAKHLDGTIEAVVHKSLPIFGVQWHPEMMADSEESKLIFDLFAELINR